MVFVSFQTADRSKIWQRICIYKKKALNIKKKVRERKIRRREADKPEVLYVTLLSVEELFTNSLFSIVPFCAVQLENLVG